MITRGVILDTAYKVFKKVGYYGASVSEITRQSGFSMGTFYQYFKNKEQVFMEINDLIIARLGERIMALPQGEGDFRSRLSQMIRLVYDHTTENFAFNRILGESELIDRVTISYYEAIADPCSEFFRDEALRGNIRALDPNIIAYGLIGICYFLVMDWQDGGVGLPADAIVEQIGDLLMSGICGPAVWQRAGDWDLPPRLEMGAVASEDQGVSTRGEKTRKSILEAAGTVFGRHGLNLANIAEITREAGVAQGTFYVYFKSKTELIEAFVKYINRQMRGTIRRAIAGIADRRDAEWMGMLVFFDFILHHREIYRIVPEWELIGREITNWYYKKIAEGYTARIQDGIDKGQIRRIPVRFLVRSLMGFSHVIGLKWIVWAPRPQQISLSLFKDIRELVLFGLKLREP